MAFKVRMKKGVDINKVVKKLVYTVLGVWIGGFILQTVASTMLGYCSPFFQGLTLFGWSVGAESTAVNTSLTSFGATLDSACEGSNYVLYDVSNAGILIIVGIIAIASVVMDFVNVSW